MLTPTINYLLAGIPWSVSDIKVSDKNSSRSVNKSASVPIVLNKGANLQQLPRNTDETVVLTEGNPQMDLQDQGVIDSGCSRHMTGNMSYLTDFEEIDRGYVVFEVPRKNNMYSVDLKNIVPKGGLTCLFAKATSDESKLWHRRLGHINFKTMNKLVKGNLVRGKAKKGYSTGEMITFCYHCGTADPLLLSKIQRRRCWIQPFRK
ncbi:ribonuclease H-like domain-containing protein [Tanacetum coccineum]